MHARRDHLLGRVPLSPNDAKVIFHHSLMNPKYG